MVEVVFAGFGVQCDADDIKAELGIDQIVLADVKQRGAFDLLLLGIGDSIVGRAILRRCNCSDLDKNHNMVVLRNNIHFAHFAAKVGLQDDVLFLLQIFPCDFFPALADVNASVFQNSGFLLIYVLT